MYLPEPLKSCTLIGTLNSFALVAKRGCPATIARLAVVSFHSRTRKLAILPTAPLALTSSPSEEAEINSGDFKISAIVSGVTSR